jgi:hypothetical protein
MNNTLGLSHDILFAQLDALTKHGGQILSSIQGGLTEKADLLKKALLEPYSKEFSMPAVIGIMILIITGKTMTTLTPLHSLLLLTTRFHTKLNFKRHHIITILTLITIDLGILIAFVAHYYFLQARYTMGLTFALLLPIPFILSSIFSSWKERRCGNHSTFTHLFPITAIVIGVMTADILTSLSPSRSYVTEAAEWFQDNIPGNCIVMTNESSFPYYANKGLLPPKAYHFKPKFRTLPDHARLYNRFFVPDEAGSTNCSCIYAAVRTKKGRIPKKWKTWLTHQNSLLLSEFTNKRKDAIQIYKITQRKP